MSLVKLNVIFEGTTFALSDKEYVIIGSTVSYLVFMTHQV